MTSRRLATLSVILTLACTLEAPADDRTTPCALDRKAEAIVQAACTFVAEHAHDLTAIQRALETDPRLRDDENHLYIFMHSYNIEKKEAICIGQGIKPELIGRNMWSLRTPNGRLVFHEFAEHARKQKEFWLEYDWLNPYTKTIETKRSFFKTISLPSAKNAWIACGFWKNAANGETTSSSSNQANSQDDHQRSKLSVADESQLSLLDQKTKAIVEAAHEFVSENPNDMNAVQSAFETDPRFRDDENHLYIFMHSYNTDREETVCLGHGVRPGLVGKNMWSLRSPGGRLLLQEMVELVQQRNEFWVEYDWLNPYTNTVEVKRSFFKKISLPSAPNAWIACGSWKQGKTGGSALSPPHTEAIASDEARHSPLARKAKAMVEAAHTFVGEHSHEMQTVQQALQNDPRFLDDENNLYIFMHAYDADRKEAVCIGHGIKPELVGKNMWSLCTPNGRLLFQEEVKLIQKYDEFWLEYDWLNPYTKSVDTKLSFFKRLSLPSAPTAWIGCGFWKNRITSPPPPFSPSTKGSPTLAKKASNHQHPNDPQDGKTQHKDDLDRYRLSIATATPLSPLDKKAKNIVEAAHVFVSEHANDMKAIQEALENDPRFRDDNDQLYIFMYSYDVDQEEIICLGHGKRTGLVGRNLWSLRSPGGILLLQEFVHLLQTHDDFWVEYEWLNPYDNTVETKRSFLKKISLPSAPNAWVACGFWKR